MIRRPGNVPLLHPVVTAMTTARSDAPQQTMVLSSHQRLTGIFGIRGGGIFQFARIFEPLWGKRTGKFWRVMILLKQLSQTCWEVYLEFLKILPESSPPPRTPIARATIHLETKIRTADENFILLTEKKFFFSVCTTNVRSYVCLIISRNHLLQQFLIPDFLLVIITDDVFPAC